ncbi:MAG TPA: TIGR03790 family protein, partial [Terriglobales bacterium]|nr:TIGR03790 family protein [Terriglobales bacterium]
MTAIFLSAQFAMAAKASLNQQVLVVYDPTVPDSVNVANHYLAARSIPSANLCAVSPPETSFALSWSNYVSKVRTPIQTCLNNLGPKNILYIVLAYIRPFSLQGQSGMVYSLDGYLADIWDQYTNQDAFPYPDLAHPYFAATQTQGNYYLPFVSFASYRAQQNAVTIYSVWRLDGATAALAEGLVDQALAAEANGLSGQACLDRQYGAIGGIYDFSYGSGDWDLHQAANFASQA